MIDQRDDFDGGSAEVTDVEEEYAPSLPDEPRLYLDNAATSFPKPGGVYEAMIRFGREIGASPGRGAYAESREAGRAVYECRRRIARLINAESPETIIFTLNATDALNLAIKGLLGHGADDHAITTWMDHNSVLRPLNALVQRGNAEQTRLPCDPMTGRVDPDDIRRAITSHTRLVVTLHGSNVCGTLQPIDEIGRICRERDVPFLVDAAQTLGHVPIDVQAMNIDLLAFPGHKGLLGPQGTGGLYIHPGLERSLRTLREGGTGSRSEEDVQPGEMPDKYEPGSHNTIGLVGLGEAVEWILDRGVETLWDHERRLMERMIARLEADSPPGLRLIGPGREGRCGVFSVVIESLEPQELAAILEEEYGLLTRAGLHCAPLAHQTLGTAKNGGTTRLSFGSFNTEHHVDAACEALIEVCRESAEIMSR